MPEIDTIREPNVVGLVTLQFANGGLLDAEPTDHLVHLVRSTEKGTPGSTLCGIDRFAPDGPGWSVGGGITGPGYVHLPCDGCAQVARTGYAGLSISGIRELRDPIVAAVA